MNYNNLCTGHAGGFEHLPGSGCNDLQIRLASTSQETVGFDIYAVTVYQILIQTVFMTGNAAAILQFSQPIVSPDVLYTISSPATLETTGTETMLLFEAPMSTFDNDNFFSLTIKTKLGRSAPCLMWNQCVFCTNCSGSKQDFLDDMFSLRIFSDYGTTLEYFCEFGLEFSDGAGSHLSSYEIQCQWDGTWNPNSTLPSCESKCIHCEIT